MFNLRRPKPASPQPSPIALEDKLQADAIRLLAFDNDVCGAIAASKARDTLRSSRLRRIFRLD